LLSSLTFICAALVLSFNLRGELVGGEFHVKLLLGAIAFVFSVCSSIQAAEIKVLSSVGFRGGLELLVNRFEHVTGHGLLLEFGTANALKRDILASTVFDIAILTPSVANELVATGHLWGWTVTNIAKSGMGVAVRAGTAKPDISSGPALLRTLARAKSIAYAKDGASGIYFMNMIDRHGLAFDKKLLGVVGGSPLQLVARGDADLGIQLVSEIKVTAGVELVGLFPEEFQNYSTLTAAVSTGTKRLDAARQFITFLRSADARATMRLVGLEPEP
jgi:molybdate transport system substrate-binding protein